MNAEIRSALQKLINELDDIRCQIEGHSENEQEKYDNLTDGLKATEKGSKYEENATSLSNAASSIDDAINSIEEAIG